MFISIDDEDEENVEGFSYTNASGDTEKVLLSKVTVVIEDSSGTCTDIYHEDIPKLIKALQAAEKHIKENKQ